MTTDEKGAFRTAFVQGLIVVFFLYVVLFNVSLFLGNASSAPPKVFSVTAPVMREQPQTVAAAPHDPHQVSPAVPQHAEETVSAHDAQGTIPADLIEKTPQGPMPKKSASGLGPFDVYKMPYADSGKPIIALAVMDFGLSEASSAAALEKLPAPVSFVLNPYAPDLGVWAGRARRVGREIWLQVPVENAQYPARADPGPHALRAHTDFKYNQENFVWALTRTSEYAGIAAFTDSAFLNAQSTLKTLLNESYGRGLGYLELNPAGLEGIEVDAVEKSLPYARPFSFYDESVVSLAAWLNDLETEAKNGGYAVGIVSAPFPHTLALIAEWHSGLQDRGIALAPISAVAHAEAATAEKADITPAPDVSGHTAP